MQKQEHEVEEIVADFATGDGKAMVGKRGEVKYAAAAESGGAKKGRRAWRWHWGKGSVALVGAWSKKDLHEIRNVGANPMCSSSSEHCDGWL